jgi:hypothetical protein
MNKKHLMIGGGILAALIIALYLKNKNKKNTCTQKNYRGECVNPKKYTLKEDYSVTIPVGSAHTGSQHTDIPDITTEKVFKSGDTIIGYLTTEMYAEDLGNANEIFVVTKADGTEPNINSDGEVWANIPIEVVTETKNFANYVDTTKNQFFQPELNKKW